MAFSDSFEKIVTSYFAAVTKQEFTYKDKTYFPKPLTVSALLFRGFTCPEMCGGCCPKFSLDYLPGTKHPSNCTRRIVTFNNKKFKLISDLQKENEGLKCKHLNYENGRCGIHGMQPFSCDFELIRTLHFQTKERPNVLTQRLFGRGWQMMRVDGIRGALCTITPVTEESFKDTLRKLRLLEQWCSHFNLENKCGDIIKWAEQTKTFILHKQDKPSIKQTF